MKKTNLVILVFLLFLAVSCSSGNFTEVRLRIPVEPKIDLRDYSIIVMTPLMIKDQKEIKDLDINKEYREYLSAEIEQNGEKTIQLNTTFPSGEDPFKDPNNWRNLLPEPDGKLILTGSLNYTEEIRKALTDKDKKRFEDPFPTESRLIERKFYNLNIELHLIDAKTGDQVYNRTFKESKAYKNPKQTAAFAFFELIKNVKNKFFQDMFGRKRTQERYLIK